MKLKLLLLLTLTFLFLPLTVANAQTQIVPQISVTPTTIAQGQSLMVTGSGFTVNVQVTVYLNVTGGNMVLFGVTSDMSGYIGQLIFIGSNVPVGSATVRAVDGTSHVSSNIVSITVTGTSVTSTTYSSATQIFSSQSQPIVYCPRTMVGINQTKLSLEFSFGPAIKLYQTSVAQETSLFVSGTGYSVNRTATIFIIPNPTFTSNNAFVQTTNVDELGHIFVDYHVGTNIQQGPVEVYVKDDTTGGTSPLKLFTVIPPTGPEQTLLTAKYWNWTFTDPTWYAENQPAIQSLATFMDAATAQYATDFGFSLGGSTRHIFVTYEQGLNPVNYAARGTWIELASAGSTEITLSSNAVVNMTEARSLLSHELGNIFQGQVSGVWPWADAKGIWRNMGQTYGKFTSPFPYVASARLLAELGYTTESEAKITGANGDCGVSLLWGILQKYGWSPYQQLFNYFQTLHVDLGQYDDTQQTATIMVLMSAGTNLDFISLFNDTFNMRGFSVPASTIQSAYNLFTGLPSISNLQDTGITVTNISPTPIPEYPTQNVILLAVFSVLITIVSLNKRRRMF